jgi:hypothetical protein
MKQSAIALKLATAAALAGSSQAYGQIVPITPPADIPGSAPSSPQVTYSENYDVLSGTTNNPLTNDFTFSYTNSANGNFFTQVYGIQSTSLVASVAPNGYLYADSLAKGDAIGSDTGLQFNRVTGPGFYGNFYGAYMTVVSGGTTPTPQQPNTNEYLGFQFLDSVDSKIHNGWIELNSKTYVDPSNPGGLIFLGAAYDSIPDGQPGGDIFAGEVPEPGTISSLVLGAAALAGVGLARRRRVASA